MFSSCFDTLRRAQCRLRRAQCRLRRAQWGQLSARSSFFIFNSSFLIFSSLFFIFHSSFVHSQVPAYVPSNGLVGWWPFNGNANDESGNGNNLANTNGMVSYASDRNGLSNSCASFNGSAYLSKSNPTLPSGNSNRTYSVWVKMNQATSGTAFCQNGGSCDNYAGLFCGIDGAYFWGKCNDRSWGYTTTTSEWNHIVLVYSNSVMYCYRNGGLLNLPNSTYYDFSTPLSTNATSFFVGYPGESGGSWPLPMNGLVDDLAIYNRALTQQEITNLYTNSLPPPSITTSAAPNLINCGESATLTASSTSAVQPCIKADLPATLQNGLVAYWPFCGNANDASGNNNNGTVNEATLTTDRFGAANKAYSFDGNDNISIANSPSLNLNSSLSISFYGKLTSPIYGIFVHIRNNSNNHETSIRANVPINFDLHNGINGASIVIPSLISLDTAWHHFISVFNTSTNISSFYVDGVLQGSSNIPITILGNTAISFGSALYSSSPNQFLTGKIDDIAIYNRALTLSEIQQLYSLGNVNYTWSTGATTSSITVSPAQTTSYSVTATNSSGSTTSSVTVTVADSLSWTGLVDTDWHKPCNWSPQFVPKCCNNVSVPLTTNQPIVSGVAAAEDLSIFTTNGAQVTVNTGANLQIADCPTTITTTACPSLAVISTTAVSSITQTTAVSGGTISYQGASAITARGVCWSMSPNPTIANSITSNGTGIGTFTSNLIGLVAGTTYFERAYATNGSGTSYGNEVSFATQTLAAQYPVGSVFCASGPTAIVDVTNPTTGKTWMDRNLGATQVATSSTDAAAYGDLYQWGRRSDGHQCRTSSTATTLSATDQPGHGNFILSPNAPYDWRSPQNDNLWQGVNGVNNPCPIGYRPPTTSELTSEKQSWTVAFSAGAFLSPLKLTLGGNRTHLGSLNATSSSGYYWTSSIDNVNLYMIKYLYFTANQDYIGDGYRANGMSIRCIKN